MMMSISLATSALKENSSLDYYSCVNHKDIYLDLLHDIGVHVESFQPRSLPGGAGISQGYFVFILSDGHHSYALMQEKALNS